VLVAELAKPRWWSQRSASSLWLGTLMAWAIEPCPAVASSSISVAPAGGSKPAAFVAVPSTTIPAASRAWRNADAVSARSPAKLMVPSELPPYIDSPSVRALPVTRSSPWSASARAAASSACRDESPNQVLVVGSWARTSTRSPSTTVAEPPSR
jgi:hypothetical protein